MLSILIPTYNFDIRPLVKELHAQCMNAGIAFEIICLDDASNLAFQKINQEIADLNDVIYKELKKNAGRSKIRNELAKAARYDFLLFMDNDSGVVREDYVKSYLQHFDPAKLLYGGRVYKDNPPAEPDHFLHWLFGKNREEASAADRQIKPHHSFMTNNFIIPKKVFEAIGFDERLVQYGHEDTLFGLELKKRKIPIIHLDNPLEHLGLETKEVFLKKNKKAIENLCFLVDENPLIETKLLSFYKKIEKWKLKRLMKYLASPLLPLLEAILKSKRPSLFIFDIYKLLLFINCKER